jgi:hypothetical protein
MDLSDTIIPKSDQINAEDLLSGPRTVTITEVHAGGSAEQPVDIVLEEFGTGRVFRPSKTVRRILVAAWGSDASKYTGRRLTIYRDPNVKFGGQDVGGIRISHLSHIDKAMNIALTVTRGKRAPYVVHPLADAPAAKPTVSVDDLLTAAQDATSNDELNHVAKAAVASLKGDDLNAVKAVVTERRAELATPGGAA